MVERKKKMNKKIISALLIFFLTLSLLSIGTVAEGVTVPVSTTFNDVATSASYCDTIECVAENGIAAGYGKSVFGADGNITHQQMATMFQRYAKYKDRSMDNTADLSAYTDASAVADWAHSAILEKRTSNYISQFIKGNFNDFYGACSDQLQKGISQDELLKSWNAIIQVTGAPGESLGSIYTKQNGYDIVVSSIAGTLYNIRVTVSYGSDGKPTGIRTSYMPKDPPKPQSADKWQEVSVTVGEKNLPGILTLPKSVQNPPVVILIQGSGSSDMNEAVGAAPNRPFEDIAHGLAEQGVATLRYNKRTYQYPTGGGDTIEYEMLDDAAAAAKLLSNDNRVDANRIYLLGHSLGGMIAPKIIADNPQIKGFISMAGSLRSFQDLMLDQNKTAIDAAVSLTKQQKEALLAQVITEIKKTKTLDDGGTNYIIGLPTNYWKSLNAIDGMAIVKGLNVPMLILQGSADFQVYPDKDYKLWQSTLEGRNNVTFKLYGGLSHLFMPKQIPANSAPDISVYNAPNHVDTQVITDIAAWVNKQ